MPHTDEGRSLWWTAIAMVLVAVGSIAGLLGDPGDLRPILIVVLIASVVVGVVALSALLRRSRS